MDIGDLLVFILIGMGVLSQLFGGKKKRPAPPSRRPRLPEPRTARTGEAGVAKQKTTSYMERILKELELDDLIEQRSGTSEPPVTIRPPLTAPPPKREPLAAPTQLADAAEESHSAREIPAAGGQSLETLEASGEAEHERFHELYIRPLASPGSEHPRSRVRKLLTNKGLRDAILLREILGPPKALE